MGFPALRSGSFNQLAAEPVSKLATLTGTALGAITEADVVAGGKTIIITLTGDAWVAAGGTFDGIRQNIIDGIDSSQAEGTGWDAVVKALQGVVGVVRTSDTVVTITLDAQATYNITSLETITVTVPASALVGGTPLVASPTFTVSAISVGGAKSWYLLQDGEDMIYLDVDTALSEVPVNVMPLIDDTDFKTRETAVAYNAAGMDLVWNFVTSAGAFTQTAVTPTTGGNYDWIHQGDGIYTIEIPASGGASINNDTEGYGWFSGVADGVLPWRGPIIGFRASGINDKLMDSAYDTNRGLAGLALPAAAADGAGGLPISDAGGLDLDAKIGALTFGTANRVNAQVYGMEANTLTAAAAASDFGEEIRSLITGGAYTLNTDANGRIRIVDGTGTGELDTLSGTVLLRSETQASIDAIEADTDELQTAWAPFTGVLNLGLWAIKAKTDGLNFTGSNVLALLADSVTHGGSSAMLRLGSSSSTPPLYITNSAGNVVRLQATGGNGTALKLDAEGTGHGLQATGGSSNGDGFNLGGNGSGAIGAGLAINPLSAAIDALPTNSELATALASADDATLAAIAALNNLSAAQVWAAGTRTLTALGFTLDSDDTDTTYINEIRDAITGYSGALNLDASGNVKISDGTGANQLSLTSGLIDGITGTINTLDQLDAAQDSQHTTTQGLISALNNLSAAQVWAAGTRTLTSGANIALAKGVGVTGFNDIAASDVLTQVETALATTTRSLPGQVTPSTTPTLAEAIMQLFQQATNPSAQDASTQRIYSRDGSVVHQKRTALDDNVTASLGALVTGP